MYFSGCIADLFLSITIKYTGFENSTYFCIDIAWWSNKFGLFDFHFVSLLHFFKAFVAFFSFKGVKVRVSHNWIHYPVTSQSLAKWCQTVEIEITLFWYSMPSFPEFSWFFVKLYFNSQKMSKIDIKSNLLNWFWTNFQQ